MNQTKTVLLLGLLSVLLVAIGGIFAPGQLYFFVILAVLMNVGSYFFSDKIVLMMNGAQEVSPAEAPELHRIVEDLALRAGIPKPRVCIIPADYANAFATGRNPAHGVVAVTAGILRMLDERELRGVLAHELSHIKNRDILVASIAATIAAAISSLASMARWGLIFSGGRSEGEEGHGALYVLVLSIVAPIAALLLQLGVSRSREYMADESGANLTGDPEGLARALNALHRSAERSPALQVNPATSSLFIVNPLAGVSGLMSLFSTHPPMEERIERLLSMAGSSTAAAHRRSADLSHSW